MVGITAVLRRVPVIKFRKGGLPSGHASSAKPAPAAAPAAAPVAAPAPAAQQAQTISTSAIPDISLPARYMRAPLSEEEISVINGGGISLLDEPKKKK